MATKIGLAIGCMLFADRYFYKNRTMIWFDGEDGCIAIECRSDTNVEGLNGIWGSLKYLDVLLELA